MTSSRLALPPGFITQMELEEGLDYNHRIERQRLSLSDRAAAASTSFCHNLFQCHCFRAEQEGICRAAPIEAFVETETLCGLKGTELSRHVN